MFEDEPDTKPGLLDCENAVIVPHIASASYWTRAGMVRPIPCQLQDLSNRSSWRWPASSFTFPFGCSGSSSAPSSEHQAAAAVLTLLGFVQASFFQGHHKKHGNNIKSCSLNAKQTQFFFILSCTQWTDDFHVI